MPDEHTTRVIAHRGASGYLPEHTMAAKSLAYGLGADFLEQDVIATRDHALVVLHDIFLDDVSDVAIHYPDRKRADGHYYVVDFDLAELRELTLCERRRPASTDLLYPGRFAFDLESFRVVTLAEEIQLVRGLNATTGRNVGIYPEIKDPRWHHDNGIDMALLLSEQLARDEYGSPDDPIFVQCFEAAELERLSQGLGMKLPLVQLLDAKAATTLKGAGSIERIAAYAQAVGVPYAALFDVVPGGDAEEIRPSALYQQLSSTDLLIHPYTFRKDELRPPWNSFQQLLDYFIHELSVDALFTDHPDAAVRALREPKSPGMDSPGQLA